ncbi:ferritin [Oceanirhabdus seepicola]|uniref:Ferritin n=1 Tax=Oceanirhabdus seepicola TaxID=2828781 RepID=A0A9J6P7L4_9CLOT|nr:ferritin [Oceanirhabdus seepicola]MCM1992284.1 ferritin [Oceanirhabdus seepicola]
MISENLFKELNTQIGFEFYSANLYLAMAAYCSSQDMDGFANFFRVQAEEERFHAMKIYDYINDMGGRVNIGAIDEPINEYSSMLDCFEKAYAHEKSVTKRFYDLISLATDEKEFATISFLQWFIDEQREEESTFNKLMKKLQRNKDNSAGVYMIDTELATRTFVVPANNR